MDKNKYIIHTDGGSRGNPGPSAIGVVIEALQQVQGKSPVLEWKKEYGEYIGETTNNDAEYQAVVFALKKLKLLIGKKTIGEAIVEVHVDSELLERQLNGHYKIMDKNIQKHFVELWNLKVDFADVVYKHIPREDNHGADRLVNAALDKELNKLL
ncbi:MAG: ribonuclease HI family protein [Candidatus Yanofskybacteria bacterium]|nr:ribonuclease HI family protein [Candidatus Yanofskybacteria bacterium]